MNSMAVTDNIVDPIVFESPGNFFSWAFLKSSIVKSKCSPRFRRFASSLTIQKTGFDSNMAFTTGFRVSTPEHDDEAKKAETGSCRSR